MSTDRSNFAVVTVIIEMDKDRYSKGKRPSRTAIKQAVDRLVGYREGNTPAYIYEKIPVKKIYIRGVNFD